MKHVFSILLFCLIFQSVLTSKRALRMKLAKFGKALRLISDAKEKKLRKLEGTDVTTDTEAGSTDTSTQIPDTSVETTAPIIKHNDTSNENEPENTNATAEDSPVPVSKPVARQPKIKDNPKAKVQITKFHSFKRPTTRGPGKVTFGTFFYFFERPIVKFIVGRLRVTYFRGLRNLQEGVTAESVRTDCKIENPNLLTTVLGEEEGANVNYNCEANATGGDASTANYTLNTDIPLTIVNSNGTIESVDFTEINFNGDTAETASSLQVNIREILRSYYLKKSTAYFDKYILKVSGDFDDHRLLRRLDLNDGNFLMNLSNTDNTTNIYDCSLSTSSSPAELTCDTSSHPLKTTVGDLHLSSGINGDKDSLFIEMRNATGNASFSIVPSGGRYTYSKSSSGLSGGAIAGIVIACVVALAAASIAAIMLRKPTPPIDNTTIVDLKTETI